MIRIILFYLITLPLSTIGQENMAAIELYQEYINRIDTRGIQKIYYVENLETYDQIALKIEKLTKIKGHREYDFRQEPDLMPNSYNMKDWETWLTLNKEKLRLTENKKDLIVVGKIHPINKDPESLYLQYVNDLNSFRKTKSYILEDLHHIKDVLDKIIPNYNFIRMIELDIDDLLPSKKEIRFLKKWFKKNKDSLYWDITEQRLCNKEISSPKN